MCYIFLILTLYLFNTAYAVSHHTLTFSFNSFPFYFDRTKAVFYFSLPIHFFLLNISSICICVKCHGPFFNRFIN